MSADRERPGFLVEGELVEAVPLARRLAPPGLRDVHERESYRWWVLVTVLSGLFATGLTITVLTTAVPFIRRDLHASLASLSWVVSAPFLFRSIFVPVFGKTGDRFGRRRTWLLGFAVSAVASLLCGFAPNVGMLILFRAIAAVGSAAVIPSALALIAVAFDPEERVKALGWWSATIAVAPLLGVIVGGFVVEAVGWRWLFFGQFPFSMVALALGLIVLRESKGDEDEQFDVAGSALSIVGLGALLLVFNRGIAGDWGWGSFPLVTTAVVAAGSLVAFVAVEMRSPAPILPVGYFGRRRFAGAVSANFCANFAYMGGFFITSVMLADTALFGYQADEVALAVSPRAASLGIMGPIGGYMAARYGGRRMATIGMTLILASMVALAVVTDGSPYLYILPGLVLSGFGLGLVAPPAAATVTNEAAESDLSAASGALNMGASIGASMGIATMSAVLSGAAATGDHPGAGAFSAAFVFGSVVCAVGLLAAANLDRRPAKRPATR
ncbi:MAG TPA: DHA2 family efflux MFS transporter permease subunit [Acidimicrobiia bacterium]